MYKNLKILALITARGGSKGIPKKNIRLFLGKPLIYWTIKEALKSGYEDKVVVDTDSAEIAKIARRYGAEVPFLRPKKLATDKANSIDVLFNSVKWFRGRGQVFGIIVLLQPTSPLRQRGDIDGTIKLLAKNGARAVVSVTDAFCSPLLMNVLPKNYSMKNFLSKRVINSRRQKLPKYFQLNGAVFTGYTDYIKKNNGFFGNKTFAYMMPRERSVDIDDIYDFKFAESLHDKTLKG
mgnify:FL=1